MDEPAAAVALPGSGSAWDYFIADQDHCRVRKVAGNPLTITTAAGNSACGGAQLATNINATDFLLGPVTGIAATSGNQLLVVDRSNTSPFPVRIQLWDDGPPAKLNTVAGATTDGSCPSVAATTNVTATTVELCLVQGVAAHPTDSDRFLIVDANEVMEVNGGQLRRVAGGGCTSPGSGAFGHCFLFARNAAYISDNEFIVTDFTTGTVTKFNAADSTAKTQIAGGGVTYPGDGGQANSAKLRSPIGVAKSYDGGYYISESDTVNGDCRIRKVAGYLASSTISTIAGSGSCLSAGRVDNVPATSTSLVLPSGISMFPGGLLMAEIFGRYTDGSGSSAAGRIRLVDRTTLLTKPPAFTNAREISFSMATLEPGVDLECSWQNPVGPISFDPGGDPCTNPMTLPAGPLHELDDGLHVFGFNVAAAPQDPTKPSASFRVDHTAPAAFALTSPADGTTGLAPTPEFSWAAASDANGITRYELWVDGKKNVDAGTGTKASAAAPLTEAQHSWQVKAFDPAGNVTASATRTFASGGAPTAALTVSPNPALVGRGVSFDAGASTDASGAIARYEWDLDGDGTFETDTGATAITSRAYESARTITVAVRVTDGVGLTATAAGELRVTSPPTTPGQFGVTINNGAQYTRTPDVTVDATFPATITSMLFSNDGGFLAPLSFSPQAQTKWKLDSSGPERLPKIVYVRFLTGPFASETHTDDIILDETPPKVGQATISAPPGAAAVAAKKKSWKVKVKATDSNSGVAHVQVTSNKRKPGKLIRYKRTLKVRSATRPKFIRARDRAGNFSRWRTARRR